MQKDIAQRCLFCLRERIAVNSRPCAGCSPTWAGKRLAATQQELQHEDHPRLCEEKQMEWISSILVSGSSPLMRGKAFASAVMICTAGIIPAHAGKRAYTRYNRQSRWDHPRSCGEKADKDLTKYASIGSSPLMRGKDFRNLDSTIRIGIIPAHAGKSAPIVPRKSLIGDHPRSCGEKAQSDTAGVATRGSSPLMRGKVRQNV